MDSIWFKDTSQLIAINVNRFFNSLGMFWYSVKKIDKYGSESLTLLYHLSIFHTIDFNEKDFVSQITTACHSYKQLQTVSFQYTEYAFI